ncbi:MAG: response regulator [Dehalococcoidia bacterium]
MASEGSKHVLVVDDSIEYLRFMEMLLCGEGFSVATLTSFDALAGSLTLQRPDLVITDVRMPGLVPFAVLEALRIDQQTATIPVLVCTGAVNELREHAEQCNGNGIDVLLKPFEVNDLLAKMAVLLSGTPTTIPA